MSNKNALVTINTCKYELSNPEFATAINTILNAEATGKQSAWVIATAYSNIIENELFTDDFENCKEFAEVMGVSTSTITQYKKAVEFITTSEIFTANELSVGKAYMLSALKDDVNEFLNWLLSNDMLIEAMTDKALKTAIKTWKDENKAIDVESVEAEVDNEVDDEVEESNIFDEVVNELSTLSDEDLMKVMEYIREVKGL